MTPRGPGKRRARRRAVMTLGLLAVLGLSAGWAVLQWAYPLKYTDAVERYAAEYGLSPALVYGIIHTESRFGPTRCRRSARAG